jgi:flagellar motor switch protein FliN/FliY
LARPVTPYPFAALEVISKSAQRNAEAARRRLGTAIGAGALERAISELLNAEIRIVVRGVRPPPERLGTAARVSVRFAEIGVDASIAVEPELATSVLCHLLQRPPLLGPAGAPLDPALSGALSALVLEVLRRIESTAVPRLVFSAPSQPASFVVDAALIFQGRPYAAELIVRVADSATLTDPELELAALPLEVDVPVVVGLSLATRAELAALEPGSAWMLGSGAWIDETGIGCGVLAAPGGDSGLSIELGAAGKTVLRGEQQRLALDAEEVMPNDDNAANRALAEAVLDTPVVMRIELGTVSLLARDVARLRPGDVLETGRRVTEPVVLRVAGREVARGELVSIEGELGVRIRQVSEEPV